MRTPQLFTFFQELTLSEGFQLLHACRPVRQHEGIPVTLPAGKSLFASLHQQGKTLKCWNCEATARLFVLAKEDGGRPKLCLKLLAAKGGNLVELTRDHIVPKSLNGSNVVENLRVSCAPCNNHRHDHLSPAELLFMQKHPELYAPRFDTRRRHGYLRTQRNPPRASLREQGKTATYAASSSFASWGLASDFRGSYQPITQALTTAVKAHTYLAVLGPILTARSRTTYTPDYPSNRT